MPTRRRVYLRRESMESKSTRREIELTSMKTGIVGVGGYGGSAARCGSSRAIRVLRLAYAGGKSSCGRKSVGSRFPALAGTPAGAVKIEPFDPEQYRAPRRALRVAAHGLVARTAHEGRRPT